MSGSYSCLAGFLEPGETIEAAVRRETFEEAGVQVGHLSNAWSGPGRFPLHHDGRPAGEALTEELTLDREELEDARWFSREEVRLMLARRHPDGLCGPAAGCNRPSSRSRMGRILQSRFH